MTTVQDAERDVLIQAVRDGWPEHGTRHYDVRGGMYLAPPVRDGGVTATLIDFAVDTALSKLRRTVTTAEDLDALTFEAVIRDAEGHVLERWGDQEIVLWGTIMTARYVPSDQIALPVTVLFEGQQ
jgi:hypothetical protein